jgi:hypothetical protein
MSATLFGLSALTDAGIDRRSIAAEAGGYFKTAKESISVLE